MDELDREAEAWLIRLTSREAGPADHAAAREWCALSADHKEAFRRARRFWRQAGTSRAALRQPRRFAQRRVFAAAAAIAVVTFVGALAATQHWSADYRTGTGDQRHLTLADGSDVLLDSATAIDVSYSAGARHIHLLSGQALFHVAHDPGRPFVVQDGAVTATALGTVYAVRHGEDGSKVTVRQGRVAVAREDGKAITLSAGEEAAVSTAGMERVRVDTATTLAWERGVLVFKQTPLEEVVAEINLRHRGVIVIASSRARHLPVSGVFRVDRLDGALESLAEVFPLQVTSIGGYISVVR